MLAIWDLWRGFQSTIIIILWVKIYTSLIFQKFISGLRFRATQFNMIWLWFLGSNVNLSSQTRTMNVKWIWVCDAEFFNTYNGRDATNVRGIRFINTLCFI
jgi:hypothetical protein